MSMQLIPEEAQADWAKHVGSHNTHDASDIIK